MPRQPSRRDLAAALAQARTELRRSKREIQNLRRENEILRAAAEPLIHHAAARDRFAFIHARRARFGVKRLCRALVTDSSSYFAWVRAQNKRRAQERDEQQLAHRIIEVHTAQPAYGVQRITRELQRQGIPVGRRVVARLMRALGIAGVTRRKRRNLTKPDAGASVVPDLIRRDFTAPMPGLKFVGDISCFPTAEDWLYLATVLDLCSKELIGYALAPHMRASLAVDAITAALRVPKTYAICRYSWRMPAARSRLRTRKVSRSMSSLGRGSQRRGLAEGPVWAVLRACFRSCELV